MFLLFSGEECGSQYSLEKVYTGCSTPGSRFGPVRTGFTQVQHSLNHEPDKILANEPEPKLNPNLGFSSRVRVLNLGSGPNFGIPKDNRHSRRPIQPSSENEAQSEIQHMARIRVLQEVVVTVQVPVPITVEAPVFQENTNPSSFTADASASSDTYTHQHVGGTCE